MGFLSFFSKPPSSTVEPLPTGSFTIDRDGVIIASTVPQSVSASRVKQIGELVLATFRGAKEAKLPLQEFVVDYAAFKLTARELRGGAMIFFSPLARSEKSKS